MIEKYLYFKMIFGQGSNHISLFGNLVKDLMIGGIFLKAFNQRMRSYIVNPRTYRGVVIGLGMAYVLGTLLIGELAIRYKVVDKENSLNQRYNPEVSAILDKVNKLSK